MSPKRRAEVWALVIVGQFPEPFLQAALQSVDWVDGYAVINTDPEGMHGPANEMIVRKTVPREKLRLERLSMSWGRFDFAKARNKALTLIPQDAYALILDADDVHWPQFRDIVWGATLDGRDVLSAHYYHLAVYKDLLHSQKYREILFKTGPGVGFENTEGTVHEVLIHPRENPVLVDGYCYSHYGYIKTAREVSRRWEFYRQLGAEIHDYDVSTPDRALDDWPRICTPHWHEHPPAVREVLEDYPRAPKPPKGEPRVGLVLLTWNDAANLKDCLASLATTEEPFNLVMVDNGSTDQTLQMYYDWNDGRAAVGELMGFILDNPGSSLAQALNTGFGYFLRQTDLEYVGWIHPDHVFIHADWLGNLVRVMDEHPEFAKLGCQEEVDAGVGLRPGNSQCYIVRRTALEQAGLFDEGFLACGGYEDWEHNARLLQVGQVMITPEAVVRHKAMGTRRHHDNQDAARHNADYYQVKVGQWEALV